MMKIFLYVYLGLIYFLSLVALLFVLNVGRGAMPKRK